MKFILLQRFFLKSDELRPISNTREVFDMRGISGREESKIASKKYSGDDLPPLTCFGDGRIFLNSISNLDSGNR